MFAAGSGTVPDTLRDFDEIVKGFLKERWIFARIFVEQTEILDLMRDTLPLNSMCGATGKHTLSNLYKNNI
jgi:hypothetical protein